MVVPSSIAVTAAPPYAGANRIRCERSTADPAALSALAWAPAGRDAPYAHTCSARDVTFLGVDRSEVLDHLEGAGLRLRDVHVQPEVMLARHHLGGTARAVGDAGVVQRCHDVLLLQGPCFVDGRLPELQPAVHAGAGTAGREHRAAREPLVVPRQ